MDTSRDVPDDYDLLINITRHREIASLNTSLLGALIRVLPKQSIRLYERADDRSPWRLSNASNINTDHGDRLDAELKDKDIALIESLRSSDERTVQQTGDDGFISVFPLRIGLEFVAAIVAEGNYRGEKSRLIDVLLEIYANIFTLLHRSAHDPLTGLLNRQTYDDRMSRLALEMADKPEQLDTDHFQKYFVMMDIDHFKKVNDTYGHLFGDEVLLNFSRLMQKNLRESDLLFRFGGEEFVVVLNNVPPETAFEVLDRFRENVASHNFPGVGKVTVSIGYTWLDLTKQTATLSARADAALYHAKRNGRNQVHLYEDLVREQLIEPITESNPDSELDLF